MQALRVLGMLIRSCCIKTQLSLAVHAALHTCVSQAINPLKALQP